MLSNEWKHFKSGTDIRGVALDGAEGAVDLTDEAVQRMAGGFLHTSKNEYTNNYFYK